MRITGKEASHQTHVRGLANSERVQKENRINGASCELGKLHSPGTGPRKTHQRHSLPLHVRSAFMSGSIRSVAARLRR